jgi:hypothetical protein
MHALSIKPLGKASRRNDTQRSANGRKPLSLYTELLLEKLPVLDVDLILECSEERLSAFGMTGGTEPLYNP